MKSAVAIFSIGIVAIGALWLATSPARVPAFSEVRSRWRPSDAQLLDRNGEPIHELRIDPRGRRLAWAAYNEISPALISVVGATEDHRYWSHRGVDFVALGSAAAHALAGRYARGASTITMQLVSLLDPSIGRISARRTVLQKLRQIFAAIALERRWSKQEILEAYFNLVTDRGELQRIGAASRVMFGKLPNGLDASESVALGEMIRAPNAHREMVLRRARQLSRELRAGVPPDEDADEALAVAVEHASANI